MRTYVAVVSLLFVASVHDASAAAGPDVTCESRNNQSTLCRIPGDGPVRLRYQLSDAPCIENRSWRRSSEGIEVENGCRAIFSTTEAEPEPPNRNTYIDLVDTDAASARATLLERGYTYISTSEDSRTDERQHFFRTPGRPACLRANERSGKFRDLDGVAAAECR